MNFTLEDTVTNITDKTWRQIWYANSNPNPNGTSKWEQNVRDDEAPDVEFWLGDVEAKAKGHQRLVTHHCSEDSQQLAWGVLEADSNTWVQSSVKHTLNLDFD